MRVQSLIKQNSLLDSPAASELGMDTKLEIHAYPSKTQTVPDTGTESNGLNGDRPLIFHKQPPFHNAIMPPNPDDTIPTRQSLLERLKNWEDQKSWQDFFFTYWRLIYGVARQAGLSDVEAQDVVQETVVSVAKKMGEFKTNPAFGSFKSWLLQITRRRICDQFRKRPRRTASWRIRCGETARTPTLEKLPDPGGPELEAIWQEEWERNLLDVAMEKVKGLVSSKQFLLFYQQVFKRWSPRKVASQYGVSLAQAYMAKYRVSGVLKREIKKLQKKMI
jgi:RNA polymerase sigma-70 factor (ECF subfamily)